MKIGDLVRIKKSINPLPLPQDWGELDSQIGIVLDMYEDMSTTHYKIQFVHEYFWIDVFMLETISTNNNGEVSE